MFNDGINNWNYSVYGFSTIRIIKKKKKILKKILKITIYERQITIICH